MSQVKDATLYEIINVEELEQKIAPSISAGITD
jgi:hypothetical protein